jgi:hypothetical protein
MTLSTVVLFAPNRQKVEAYLAHFVRTFLLPTTINTSIRYNAWIDISTATLTPSSITPAVLAWLGTVSGLPVPSLGITAAVCDQHKRHVNVYRMIQFFVSRAHSAATSEKNLKAVARCDVEIYSQKISQNTTELTVNECTLCPTTFLFDKNTSTRAPDDPAGRCTLNNGHFSGTIMAFCGSVL